MQKNMSFVLHIFKYPAALYTKHFIMNAQVVKIIGFLIVISFISVTPKMFLTLLF